MCRGLSEDVCKLSELDVNAYGQPTQPDEHGFRTGCPPPEAAAQVLRQTAEEAERAVNHLLVSMVRMRLTSGQKRLIVHDHQS